MISPAKTEYSNEMIAGEVVSGKTAFYEVLVKRCNPLLYKIGRSYGFGHEDTQDLMQETYISAYLNLAKFEGRSKIKTWIARIMINNCYHRKQKNNRFSEKNIDELKHETMASDQQPHLKRELGQVLEQALDSIPEDYRLVFTLRELNGFSTRETAESSGLSETNVKVRLNRAKSMLRKKVESMYSEADIYEFNLVHCDPFTKRVMTFINNLVPSQDPFAAAI
jgi:RNA polymerase sigma factor (sigma-70 family)